MKRELFMTADGSSSLRLMDCDEQYHSKHGAIQEANHVFIQNGLYHFIKNFKPQKALSILEIGFGTGLNALLTALYAEKHKIPVNYTGLEAYPLTKNEWETMNYPSQLKNTSAQAIFKAMHQVEWEDYKKISTSFWLKKQKSKFEDFHEINKFNLIYFDAFGAQTQPELWGEPIFKAMYKALYSGGILVTYSAKGSVRRALQAIGFVVERLPGPPGKREMLRAFKKA